MSVIAIYDSGYGGIPVLHAFLGRYPKNTYLYYGDNLRMPYGKKSREELLSVAKENVSFLTGFSPDLIVLACNTMSELILSDLQEEVEIPIVGVRQNFDALGKAGSAVVLCTEATARSPALKKLSLNKNFHVVQAVGLAEEIEDNIFELEKKGWGRAFAPVFSGNYDTVFLGCTHYVWIIKYLKSAYPNLSFYDGIEECLLRAAPYLEVEKEKGAEKEGAGCVHFVGECAIRNQNAYLLFMRTYV